MKAKSCIAALALATATFSTQAVPIVNQTLPFDGFGGASFGNTPDTVGSFTDTWLFTLIPGPFNLTSGGLQTTIIGSSDIDFGVLTISRTSGPPESFAFTQTSFDPAQEGWELPAGVYLESGIEYKLSVSGNLLNTTGARYSGTLSTLVVPEPETYALILAGLGAITFVARRRRPMR